MINLEIDNSKEVAKSGKWENPGAKLYDQLLRSWYFADLNGENSNDVVNDPRNKSWKDMLEETYLIAPVKQIKNTPHGVTPYSRSGCKYPHHVIKGDKLVLHVDGLKAAYQRAKQHGVFKGDVKEHLIRHYKELDIYEDSTIKIDERMEANFASIESYIMESTMDDELDWIESYLMEEGEQDSDAPPDLEEPKPGEKPTQNTSNTPAGQPEEQKDDTPPDIEAPAEDTPPQEEIPEEPEKKEEPPPKKESFPKRTDRDEADKNGVRRKKLYIAFIEWAKAYNSKNTFGSVFDQDAFSVTYPFVPKEMRYFYRLANPMLCVLEDDFTMFALAELRKVNMKNHKLYEMMIFAGTKENMRVFNNKDKQVYVATEENGQLKLGEARGDFDSWLQTMINKGDILHGPIEETKPAA